MDIDIDTAAAEAVKALLPAKSEKIYEKQYKHFLDWCQAKDVADVTQEKVLLAYFFHHAKNLKASTVSHYSMIKSKLIVEKSLDIGKYSKLKAFLKRNGYGYRPKKSRILDMDHIQQFLQEAPNQEYLMIKEDNEEVNYFDDEEKDADANPDKYDDEEDDEFYKEFDMDREVQDEASTTVKISVKSAESETSDFTNYKWENYGTINAIRQSRQKMASLKSGSSIEEKKKAVMAHYNFVRNINQCSIPKPKVIPVQQMHPNSSITYIPHCTVLHRCGEDTGCCEQDKTCQYKTRLEVHLYVYTRLIGSNALQAEKLLFYNDTSCECRAKNQKNPAVIQLTNKGRREIPTKAGISFSGNGQTKCDCPAEFSPKIKYSTKCFCGCEDDNDACMRMKKGKEYFSMTDRECLLNNKCGIMECEYGQYIKRLGRCPRRNGD